ncbi:DUF4811 domain-containing protein [Leuconostocaceae bacterium ESL0958]|nr:DUF4811 domain-containing protein [Leuconostocaceae bacterium ESL0958]
MMIWIIALLAFLTFASWMLLATKWLRITLGTVFGLLFALAIVLLSANMDQHFGMEKKTVTSTEQVYAATPAQSPVQAVAAKKIGPARYVLVYKDHEQDPAAKAHFVPDSKDVVRAVKVRADYEQTQTSTAQVKTVTETWIYRSNFWKQLFQHQHDDRLISEHHTLQVPENWQIQQQ